MRHSLNSLKGVIYGTTIGVTKGDTRSLDSNSHAQVALEVIMNSVA